jgi:ATP-dependent Clp protease adaptor protein ClpS
VWASGGDVVTAPERVVRPVESEETATEPPWNVVIFNDPVNLMQYVTLVIQRVFGYPKGKAESMMLDVHQKGKCVVWSGPRERAEHYTQLLQWGGEHYGDIAVGDEGPAGGAGAGGCFRA